MTIETSNHNVYSYLHSTNEIVRDVVEDDYTWRFEPLKPFCEFPLVDMVIIGVTEQCNLRCSYCCYSGKYKKNRVHGTHSLDRSGIDSILQFIDKNIRNRPVRIAFYGGEPLICYDLIQYAIVQAENKFGQEVTFSVSTNSVLLSEEKIDWLIGHDVEMQISIDGPEPYHDVNRKGSDGLGSFNRVKNSLLYIVENHFEYFNRVQLMMTLSNLENLLPIAEEWNKDKVLRSLKPANITAIAPNSEIEVPKQDFEDLQNSFKQILEVYQSHRDWGVLQAYLDGCLIYWINRPITEREETIPLATCLPFNTKLFIDTQLNIGVCEKFADQYRIGNVTTGVDFQLARDLVEVHRNRKEKRCKSCSCYRMCDLCLTTIEFDEVQFDILCHNEQVYCKLYFWLFCEMVERGLLTTKRVPEIYTNSTLLCEIQDKDISSLRVIFQDKDTQRFLPELYELVKTESGMRQYLVSSRNLFLQGEGILWGIYDSGILEGLVGIIDITSTPTIYYAIHPKYRNKGIMTDVLNFVILYLQQFSICKCLLTEIIVGNIPSQRILTRYGFQLIENKDNRLYYYKEFDKKHFDKR